MDIKKIQSSLVMEKLFFSSFNFHREKDIKNGECSIDLQRHITDVGEHKHSVTLTIDISKEDLSLSLVANADFCFVGDNAELEKNLIKNNAVAIMFPFIRSQVTLLTSQPSMTPLVLPPIDVTKIVD